MDIKVLTLFFQNLTIIVGVIYVLTALIVFLAPNFIISIQKKFANIDHKTLQSFLYGYVGLFKIIFIVFVVGPYIALLLMD